MIYVGLDLHKKTIQIAAVDYRGATLLNKKIRNTHASLEMEISRMPKGSKYVIESSSVWEDVYHYMRNELGLDVVLSDPYKTKLEDEASQKPGYGWRRTGGRDTVRTAEHSWRVSGRANGSG